MDKCLFCNIVAGKVPAKKVFETDTLIAFPDIDPSADVHILIVPKQHIADIKEAEDNGELLSEIFTAANKLVKDFNLSDNLYRVVVNGGKAQHIPHLHFHLLGGQWKKQV